MEAELMRYDLGGGAEAFTSGRDAVLPYPVIQPRQAHSDSVAYVGGDDMKAGALEGVDALVTDARGLAVGVRTADCIPVLLHDPVRGAVAAVHSGWRGTVNRISSKAVLRMQCLFGTRPDDILAVVGPGIGEGSFQVGEEVAMAFKDAGFPMDRVWSFQGAREEGTMRGGHHLDLKECVRLTLAGCGVLPSNIQVSGIDTYVDGRFYSARREGVSCGRNVNAVMLL